MVGIYGAWDETCIHAFLVHIEALKNQRIKFCHKLQPTDLMAATSLKKSHLSAENEIPTSQVGVSSQAVLKSVERCMHFTKLGTCVLRAP